MVTKSTDSSNSFIWATIGKVGALVSLIIAILTLYTQLYPDKAKVISRCQTFQSFGSPKSSSNNAASSTMPESKPASDAKNLSQQKPNAQKNRESEKTLIEGIIANNKKLLERVDIKPPDIVIQCEVTNKGRQEAKDVVVDFPVDVTASLVNEKPVVVSESSPKSVSLGTLRPNGKITLVAWSDSYNRFSASREEGYSLSFSGGVGIVQFPHLAYGWIGSTAAFLEFSAENPFILLLITVTILVPLLGELLPLLKKKSSNKENSNLQENSELDSESQKAIPTIAGSKDRPTEKPESSRPSFSQATHATSNKDSWRD